MKDLHIIGLGAQTTLGRSMGSTYTAIDAGLSRMTVHPEVVDRDDELVAVSMASYLAEDLPAIDRMVELSIQAIRETLTPLSQRLESEGTPIPLVLGLPSLRPGLPKSFESQISNGITRGLGQGSSLGGVQTLPADHAAGMLAIERAIDLIRGGRYSMILAGGCDSYIEPETLRWLDEKGLLRSSTSAAGFFPGEGASFCLLASAEAAKGCLSFGRIHALATAIDEQPQGSKEASLGSSLSKAWRSALSALPSEGRIAHLICDQNGEVSRSEALSTTIHELHPHLSRSLEFMSPAMFLGDVGAASGPLFTGMVSAGIAMTESAEGFGLVSTGTIGGPQGAALIGAGVAEGRRLD